MVPALGIVFAITMVLTGLTAMLAISNLTSGALPKGSGAKSALRGPMNSTHSMVAVSQASQPPCQCEASNSAWVASTRTVPKCVFIDLGAADGNSFQSFLSDGYGPVSGCPSGQWEAYLVEANPRFNDQLGQMVARHPGSVHAFTSTAAYDCEGSTTFYLDTTSHEHNYWGSSLSSNAGDVQRSGLQRVDVKLVNLNRLIYEHTIPGDWVMVKMDIEGAEWDMVPCLAQASAASLIDRMYIEVHGADLSLRGTTVAQFEAAKAALKQKGVDIPQYFSNTL